jgi:hypothetical protein
MIPSASANEVGSERPTSQLVAIVPRKSEEIAVPADAGRLQSSADLLKSFVRSIKGIPHEFAYECVTSGEIIAGAIVHPPPSAYEMRSWVQGNA